MEHGVTEMCKIPFSHYLFFKNKNRLLTIADRKYQNTGKSLFTL